MSKARPGSRWMSRRTARPAWVFTIPKANYAPLSLSARLGRPGWDYTMPTANCAPVLMCPRPIRLAWPFTNKAANPPGELRSHPRASIRGEIAMRRLLQQMLILGLLCFWVSGCSGPRYGYYDSPGYGYAPYSYGWPYYSRGYRPGFADHHSWEEHHFQGHPGAFGGGHV